jgi:capsular polysaccharide biosynthesis protein
MSISSLRLSLIFWLRRFPTLYRVVGRVCQVFSDLFIGLLRVIIPASVPSGPAKGYFSDYDLLLNKKVEGKVWATSQQVPPAPANSLRRKCGFEQDLNQPWPIFWTLHVNARLVSKTLVLQDDQKRISLEGAFGPICVKSDPAYRKIFLPAPTRLAGNWTSITGRWLDGFYHWFMDGLPRLAMLRDLPPDTRIIVPARLLPYQQQTLEWLGLGNHIRLTEEKHLFIENYYFCAPTSMTGCYNPFAVQFLRQALLPHADLAYNPPPRFYLRRVGKYRGILNENDVLDFFRKRGWAIIDTEQLPLAQQIRLFSRAEMICAPHGAGLTNLLWCPPGCKVLELCASTFLNGVYEGLAECTALRHRYLIFEGDNTYHSCVDLEKVESALEF